MFNPVKFDQSGYPGLLANVGTVYGANLAPPRNGMENARGGPVFGMNSISEPNTSPDVITVAGVFYFPQGRNAKLQFKDGLHVPSGTPIMVFPVLARNGRMAYDRHGEPEHMLIIMNVQTDDDGKLNAKKCFHPKKAGGKISVGFPTVTVGDVKIEGGKTQHVAVAIQNVATVNVHPNHRHEFKNVAIGDKLLMSCPLDGMPMTATGKKSYRLFRPFQTETLVNGRDNLNVLTKQRVLTVVSDFVGNSIRCDIGPVIQQESPGGFGPVPVADTTLRADGAAVVADDDIAGDVADRLVGAGNWLDSFWEVVSNIAAYDPMNIGGLFEDT